MNPSRDREQEFCRHLRALIDTKKTYHAVLLLSGGKDSAYILWRIRSEFPELRILCVFVNNGFSSPYAEASAKFVAEKFHADFLTINSAIDQFKENFRQAFLALQGRGGYGVIDKADGDLIFALGRKVALEFGISTVLAGLSWVQLERIFSTTDYRLEQEKGVTTLFPLAVWRTSETDIRSAVQKEHLMPPGSESPIVSNNQLILVMSVVDVLNNGYSSFEPEMAQLVREKKADRKTWLYTFELLEFATNMGFLSKDLARGLNRLSLKPSDIIKEKQ